MEKQSKETTGKIYDKIQIRSLKTVYILEVKDIVRCESSKSYTVVYMTDGRNIVASHTLKCFEALMPYPLFLRVHQSHLVNSSFIKEINKQESTIILSDNTHVPVSCRRRVLVDKYLSLMPVV